MIIIIIVIATDNVARTTTWTSRRVEDQEDVGGAKLNRT
jgi:hypothetical protein